MRKSVALLIGVGLIMAIGLGEGYELALQNLTPSVWKYKQIEKYCEYCVWLRDSGVVIEESTGIAKCSDLPDLLDRKWCPANVKAANIVMQMFGVF
jgi:hypothetical protein